MMSDELQGEKRHYLTVFVNSALNILKIELDTVFKKRSMQLKRNTKSGYPIYSVIGFTSDSIRGQVVYGMTQDLAFGITKHLMPDLRPVEQKKMVGGIVGEIANMISGQATAELSRKDKMLITPPVVIDTDSEQSTVSFLELPTISFLLDSTMGSLEVNIAFKEIGAS